MKYCNGPKTTLNINPASLNLPGCLATSEDVKSFDRSPWKMWKNTRRASYIPDTFLSNTHTVHMPTHTSREESKTCQRSLFILHVSVKDKKLADTRASASGQRVTGSQHSLVWKWLREKRTISSNPTMLSMFRGTHRAQQARDNACFC